MAAASHGTRQIPHNKPATRSHASHRAFTAVGDRRRSVRSRDADHAVRPLVAAAMSAVAEPDINQHVREGASEAELVQLQVPHGCIAVWSYDRKKERIVIAFNEVVLVGISLRIWTLNQADKADAAQQRLADALPPFDPHSGVAEAVVVGCGPAGLSLAAELANLGVRAVLIGEHTTPSRMSALRMEWPERSHFAC
jgi:FAD binding domain